MQRSHGHLTGVQPARSTLAAAALAALLAACGPTGGGTTSTSSSGTSGTSGGSSGNGGSSGQTSSSGSSSGGVECPALVCALFCEFGYRSDATGCPTCSCIPDPRSCDQLDNESCRATDRCALVQSGSSGSTATQCCARQSDGTIDCTGTPPPPVCMQDSECAPGQACNTQDFCERAPGCTANGDCPAVCYGRCVPINGGCASDHDCAATEQCSFPDIPPCDPNGGACSSPVIAGVCVPVACATVVRLCDDGSTPSGYLDVPHGCPVPICGGECQGLPPDQCQARPDCQAIFGGGECDCSCAPNGECPPCACPSPTYECVPRSGCFSDAQCAPGDFCDFSFDDCLNCAQPASGVCRPRGSICETLDEQTCRATDGCNPQYGERCAACQPGEVCPCETAFLGCRPADVQFCSRDLECGPGMRCNLCPPFPGCPECDACGPPACEPAPVERCTSDDACGPGRFCQYQACTDSFPPVCVGQCVDAPVACGQLDEQRCQGTPGCQPLYNQTCNDGCHDELGRLTSCGPCLAIACQPGIFAGCEEAVPTCCSDYECGRGQTCVVPADGGGVGRCEGFTTVCGETFGSCPAGAECVPVGCAGSGSAGGSPGGSSSPPSNDPACRPVFDCLPVAGCTTDVECGPGMRCNTCPADPDCPSCAVCGPSRCESAPSTCGADVACPDGCACRNGTCVGPDDGACGVRPFRVCSQDSQCLEDEYCQRCPPGAACFVEDHCAPRERPMRQCTVNGDCLQDERCESGLCVAGPPSLRECSSNLECRPDEYCQVCPPNALCLLPDHCEPRTFRECEIDAQCLPDEFCARCPQDGTCFVADHCQVRTFQECQSNMDCPAGQQCQRCPPNADCLLADHCVPN